ncbi:hypothetical protein, variant [Exophiala xenobiotica]|uniref:NmrA-like domain-containing protein n=1 Tax=Exophiala xenobiotica TaxID=348802 RepID=A0A0D2CQZ5_9EURO|nr:hypothetical protein, variant [Exophiala xenobiotica]KIW52412.1 hypothetical protein, variant [Exophiala xenobiotica]
MECRLLTDIDDIWETFADEAFKNQEISSQLLPLQSVFAFDVHNNSVYGAPISYVDYGSTDSLTSALKGIHTLISVLKVNDPMAMISYHSNLLKSCISAKVSRYAPSDWSMGPSSHSKVDLLAHKDRLWQDCQEIGIKNGIECASFHNGMFMNYLAQGKLTCPAEDEQFALGGLEDDLMLQYIDIPHGKLVIPIDNQGHSSPTSMTHIGDIGTFVAAAVDLPPGQWTGHLGMVGDTCTFQHVKHLLTEVGIQVQHETITADQCDEKIRDLDEQLARGFNIGALKGKMVAQMLKVQCEGQFGGSVFESSLNRLCPQVKPVKISEFIQRVY